MLMEGTCHMVMKNQRIYKPTSNCKNLMLTDVIPKLTTNSQDICAAWLPKKSVTLRGLSEAL